MSRKNLSIRLRSSSCCRNGMAIAVLPLRNRAVSDVADDILLAGDMDETVARGPRLNLVARAVKDQLGVENLLLRLEAPLLRLQSYTLVASARHLRVAGDIGDQSHRKT